MSFALKGTVQLKNENISGASQLNSSWRLDLRQKNSFYTLQNLLLALPDYFDTEEIFKTQYSQAGSAQTQHIWCDPSAPGMFVDCPFKDDLCQASPLMLNYSI